MGVRRLLSSVSSLPSRTMQRVCRISSAEEANKLVDAVDFVLTDCDGVLYRSQGPIPGAVEALTRLRAKGKKIIFVTNNSTVSRVKATEKLNGMGFGADVHDVFPTSFAVADYFKRRAFTGKVFVVGCQGIRDELDAACIPHFGHEVDQLLPDVVIPDVTTDLAVDAVVLAYDNTISMPKLIKACTYASKVEPEFFVGAEPDESILRVNGQILPLAGSIIAFVETAIHKRAVILGKPMSHLFQSVREGHPSLNPNRTLMIGDRLNTDIAFGNNNAVKYTLLVESGEHKFEEAVSASQTAGREKHVPTHCAPSLGYLNQFL